MMITEMITEKNIGLTTTSLFEQMLFPFKETLEKASAVHKTNQLKKVDSFFNNLTLRLVKEGEEYWESLVPQDDSEMFARWVFAIMSVHTTWESNVRGYECAMRDLSWTISKDKLKQLIVDAKVGLYERRERGLWELATKFREDPDQFKKQDDETWQECRNRLIGSIYGLGNAKTTYALSLSYPIESQLCCLDVHLLRFMGHDLKKGHANTLQAYQEMEKEWLDRCNKFGVSPNVAREIYWNKVQGRRNSRYWSYCLES
jgi:hypothetical protein|tara:strand:- start:904 stop:1680 length:777 start_codon:yes stop_codon:yes gene_type:complete